VRRALAATLLVAAAGAQAQGDATFVYDPYVPTPQAIVEQMLALAEVGADDLVVDLGSGDGRIVITAARRYGARGLGVEIDRSLVAEAKSAARELGVAERVRFVARDLHQVDLREATVLTLYLLPETNRKLLPKILAEMPAGARVVSHRFAVGDWHPAATVVVDAGEDWTALGKERNIHLYRVPARVSGTWEVRCEDGAVFRLVLVQARESITGAAVAADVALALDRGAVNGREIRFRLAGPAPLAGDYAGTADGDRIAGRRRGASEVGWRAVRLAGD
jgi:SAM-dependent methyltransferase